MPKGKQEKSAVLRGYTVKKISPIQANKTSWNAVTKSGRFNRPETGWFFCKKTFLEARCF